MTEEVARQEPAAKAAAPSEAPSPPVASGAAGAGNVPGVAPPPPDDENPALIDARKTFIITVVGAGLFIAAVVLFIL
jgi:hypothetical protein